MREWWRVKIHGRVVLASSHVDSMRHNTEMIRTLSEARSERPDGDERVVEDVRTQRLQKPAG